MFVQITAGNEHASDNIEVSDRENMSCSSL